MNIRRCPKCGGCVPEGNEVCNHCGHRMFFIGNNGMKKSINASGCVVFIVIMMFVFPFIIALIDEIDILNTFLTEVYNVITDNNPYFDKSYNEKDDYYDYEDDYYDYDYEDDYSDYEDDYYNDDSSANNYMNGDVSSWYRDVTSGKTVVSVICDTKISECINYSIITTMSSFSNDFILHFFNINYLSESEKNILLNTYDLPGYYNYDSPYTFIVKDGIVSANISGMMYEKAFEKFLIENGVISN